MADQEKTGEALAKIPIVEVGPSFAYPHPKVDGMPEGVIGHPGEHLEHEPITDKGKIVAVPAVGHGEKIITTPSAEDVERLLKVGEGESGHWLGEFLRHKRKSQVPSTKSQTNSNV